jgi:hypothetical protein
MAIFALPPVRERLDDSLADKPAAITEMGPVDPRTSSVCFNVRSRWEDHRLHLVRSRWRLGLRTRPEAEQVAVAAP